MRAHADPLKIKNMMPNSDVCFSDQAMRTCGLVAVVPKFSSAAKDSVEKLNRAGKTANIGRQTYKTVLW